MPTTVSNAYYNAAKELANHIANDDHERESLKELIRHGCDPQGHILYKAAIVGGWEPEFETMVEEIKKYSGIA